MSGFSCQEADFTDPLLLCLPSCPLPPSLPQTAGGRVVMIKKRVKKRLQGGPRWVANTGIEITILNCPVDRNSAMLRFLQPQWMTRRCCNISSSLQRVLLHQCYSRPGLPWARWRLCSLCLSDQEHMPCWSMPTVLLFSLPVHLLSYKSPPVTTHKVRHTTSFEWRYWNLLLKVVVLQCSSFLIWFRWS